MRRDRAAAPGDPAGAAVDSPPMKSIVVGTAGHIDHGKSALVRALTGIDPDRLKEEKARGITIDLGFAHLDVGDTQIAFVDVPGHERFVRNMLAGAGGIDAVVLVVAADESIKPQTREHFHICRLLGIERGLVALTKADLVEPDLLELAALEVRELVAGSFLAGAPIVPVSARTGQGLETLSTELATLAGARRAARGAIVRLPIDRVFTVKGFGAVVTGTLVSGRVAVGDELTVLPEGRLVRVRGVQVHGKKTSDVEAPHRVAINLGGVDVEDVARGDTLASADALAVTRRVDLRVQLLEEARALRHGARVRVHHGTSEVIGRVSIAATRPAAGGAWAPARVGDLGVSAAPGGEALVRLRLDRPAVLTRGDRVVFRAVSPPVTIGGGVVLDPLAPAGGVRRAAALDRFARLSSDRDALGVWLSEAGGRGIDPQRFVQRGGLTPDGARAAADALAAGGEARRAGGRLFDAAAAAAIEHGVQAELAAFHRTHPLEPGASREAVRETVAPSANPALFDAVIEDLLARRVVGGTDRLALAAHRPTLSPQETQARAVIIDQVRAARLTPPDAPALAAAAGLAPAALDRLLQMLVRERALVRIDAWVFDPEALAGLKSSIQGLRTEAPAGQPPTVDVATFKARFGLSRKFAIPLLEWLDRERVTRRVGDRRLVI